MPVFRWIALAAWVFWVITYWAGGIRALADIRKALAAGNRLDAVMMGLISLAGAVVIVIGAAICLGYIRVHTAAYAYDPALSALGTLVTLAGTAGTYYCRHHLGRFWTAENALVEDHQIVDSGPYGLVRHPIYTSAIVMYVGTAMVFTTWWVWIACAVAITAYVVKTADEDRFLAANLPGYDEYSGRVRYRLVPGLW